MKSRINITLYLQNRKAQLPTTHIHSNVAHALILNFVWIRNQFDKWMTIVNIVQFTMEPYFFCFQALVLLVVVRLFFYLHFSIVLSIPLMLIQTNLTQNTKKSQFKTSNSGICCCVFCLSFFVCFFSLVVKQFWFCVGTIFFSLFFYVTSFCFNHPRQFKKCTLYIIFCDIYNIFWDDLWQLIIYNM